jgi:4-hydroxy-2-oxoheptanedioate aldolase
MRYGFKSRLARGRPALGCLANMGSPVAAEILGLAGYDCVMVDMEHGPGDVFNTLQQLQAIAATPAVPLLRVPENAPVYLKRALDAGPNGVMVPAVETAEDARQAVAACRYPPRGLRGVAHPIARASGYGTDTARYIAESEAELLIICQVETLQGVEHARAIAAEDGVDMIFLGPMDLSASAGFFNVPDHPQVEALIGRVEAEVKTAGKLLGGLATPARPASVLFERGYAFVLDAVDIGLLRDAARKSVEASRRYTAG